MKTLQVAAVSQETKAFWSGILIPELMSSEDKRIDEVKDENFFMVRPLPWHEGRYDAFMEKLNRQHKKTASASSKFRMLPRMVGVNSDRLPPNHLKDCNKWIIKTTN